jgi:D-hydroxyproline dehydrogenase subunit gamma
MPQGLRIGEGLGGRRSLRFRFEGQPVVAYEGESVATALLASGIRKLRRNPVDGGPRGVFCAMGLCQECLVEVEGSAVEACRLAVTEGLEVSRLP